jgi:hypothetical protein
MPTPLPAQLIPPALLFPFPLSHDGGDGALCDDARVGVLPLAVIWQRGQVARRVVGADVGVLWWWWWWLLWWWGRRDMGCNTGTVEGV